MKKFGVLLLVMLAFLGLALIKPSQEVTITKSPTEMKQYEIKEIDFPGGKYYGIKYDIAISDLDSTIYSEAYGKLVGTIMKNGLEMAGMPVSFGLEWDEENGRCVVAPAIPVVAYGDKMGEGIETFTIEPCKALVVDYYGEYDQTATAHEQLGAYALEQKAEVSYVMEEFVTDPSTVESMDQCLTKIYYFIK